MTRITAGWITNPATQNVCSALAAEGGQVLFVGGCVRNSLLGLPVSDIDISTDSEPDTVMKLARVAGIKSIPTGLIHGTVTLVSDGLTHEVTTFRKDIESDGRHAVVAFSKHIEEDAARRDFTMNALYARVDGTVVDPLAGMADLKARCVRFIGRADDRIKEDYLRSLRYFRFHAWYGDANAGFDPDALAAIASHLDGLALLSRERVGAEMLKLLAARDPASSVAAMRSTGVLGQVLAGADDRALSPLVHIEQEAGVSPDPIRRLAAIVSDDVAKTLRLSRAQVTRLTGLRQGVSTTAKSGELAYRLGREMALDVLILRCALLEHPWENSTLEEIEKGAAVRFPVRAKDLMPALAGPDIGARLKLLESLWIASDFSLTRSQLLNSP